MTGDEPASKRRRLDAARTTLRKPFKSPLVKRPGDPSRTAFEGTKKAFASASRSPGTLVVRARGTAVRGRTVDGSPAAKAVSEKDRKHEILTLLSRRKKEIENQTRELRQRLDLVKQAHSIESASSRKRPDGEVDAELRQLIQKWKKASCSAASELFDLIKERVERYVIGLRRGTANFLLTREWL
jgi:Swi5-dependent recombination DNA repair protein 1